MMKDPEIFLWLRVKAGDKNAFKILFEMHYPTLCLLSNRYILDITTAREVVQDIFINIWERREILDIQTSLKSYLHQAVRFNSIRRLDNDKKNGILMATVPDSGPDPEFHDHLEYAELQNCILEAVELLPGQCQKVFKLSRFERLTYNEIAGQMNLSVKTVEAHISKALRLIQDYLNKTC
jgi:RNA polymerase sigma-70 factor, ECF subfamily